MPGSDPTSEEKVNRVHEALMGDPTLPQLLNWVLATAVRYAGVDKLSATELVSLYVQLAEDAKTGAPIFH
jgi:hypothetical protein